MLITAAISCLIGVMLSANGMIFPHSAESAAAVANAEMAADHEKAYSVEWQLLSREAHQTMSQQDWSKLFTTCFGTEPQPGPPIHVVSTRVRGNVATFTFNRPEPPDETGQVGYAIFESGHWRWQPPAGHMRLYRLGAQGAIDKLRAAGECPGK